MLWDLSAPPSKAIRNVIHGHTRAITDINFHSKNAKFLATSSIDSYIHCWDLNNTQKPAISFAEFFSGANQVKWSRKNEYILASSHDSRVLIWDTRKNSIPVTTIKAHPLKVNGLDFSRTNPTELMTCSNDGTVKIWNFERNTELPSHTIKTDFPVGRARFTPFGNGALIMPSRGGYNTVSLVDIRDKENSENFKPVYQFKAHTKPVREFVWRTRGGDNENFENRQFQLVTWSEDKDLRLWPVDQSTLEKVGYKKGAPITVPMTRRGAKYETYHAEPSEVKPLGSLDRNHFRTKKPARGSYGSSPSALRSYLNTGVMGNRAKPGIASAFMTRAGNRSNGETDDDKWNSPLQWISGVRIGPSALSDSGPTGSKKLPQYEEYKNLGEEVTFVGHQFPQINFSNISLKTREITVELNGSPNGFENELVFLRVNIKFPFDYPAHPPVFLIQENYKLTLENIREIGVELNVFAEKLAKHNKYCLEPCLRILLGEKLSPLDYLKDEALDLDLNPGTPPESLIGSSSSSVNNFFSSDDENAPSKIMNAPEPKGCGAYWSKSGYLVCFFMPKKDLSDRFFTGDTNGDDATNLLHTSKLFTGSNTNSEDDSNGFSSESEDSDDTVAVRWPVRDIFISNVRVKSIGNGAGPLSNTSRPVKPREEKPKNLIKILDFRHLIPARRELAAEYEILGSDPRQLCQHNAEVAAKYDCREVADCWKLIEMILTTHVSLVDSIKTFEKNGEQSEIANLAVKGAFQWGNHPFGRKWLVDQLFDYFEKLQNPQMLANMSCIFTLGTITPHPLTISLPTNDVFFFPKSTSPYFDSRKGSTGPHSNIQTPYFTGKSFPWDFGVSSPTSFGHKFDPDSLGIMGTSNSPKVSKTVPQTQISEISPTSSKGSSVISSSPEKFSSTRRAVANLFSRSGTQIQPNLTQHSSLSNNLQTHKRETSHTSISTAGPISAGYWINHMNSTSPNTSTSHSPLISSSVASASAAQINRGYSEYDLSLPMTFNTNPNTRLPSRNSINGLNDTAAVDFNADAGFPRLRYTILDESLLDHGESLSPSTLLDVTKKEKYQLYRMQYAGVLFLWGLEVASLEVLKFNYKNDTIGNRPFGTRNLTGRNASLTNKTNSRHSEFESLHSADIHFHSLHSNHDSETDIDGPPRSNNHKLCQYCKLTVRKRLFFCLKCEHILHADCAKEWWNDCEADECASGCGCKCLE